MMVTTSIDILGQRTSTAVASYGSLIRGSRLKESLTDPNGSANFTSIQADAFVAQYDLLDQLPNVSLIGFSASVFLDKQIGKHVTAMRGTEVPIVSQFVLDLFKEDGLSIGGNGFANTQAVEMSRYYKRLTTAGGAAVQFRSGRGVDAARGSPGARRASAGTATRPACSASPSQARMSSPAFWQPTVFTTSRTPATRSTPAPATTMSAQVQLPTRCMVARATTTSTAWAAPTMARVAATSTLAATTGSWHAPRN